MNASQQFAQRVNNNLNDSGGDYGLAYRRTAEEHPDLHILVRASGKTRQELELFNAKLARKAAAPARKVANERFAELLNEATDRHPLFSYDQIFNRVARENPELLGVAPKGNEFTNDSAPSAVSPAAGAQTAALLMLPADTNQRVFDACFRANGSKFAPLKHGDVFNATINERAAETGQPYATALAWCKTTYGQLWRMVEEVAKF